MTNGVSDHDQPPIVGYAWCYWPNGDAWLAEIVGGSVGEPLATVTRDRSGCWLWTTAQMAPWRLGRFGTEPTLDHALNAASVEISRAVPLPSRHPAIKRRSE